MAVLVVTGAPVVGQTTERVSLPATGTQAIGGKYTPRPSISADGSVGAFESPLSTLVAGDTNSVSDIFVVAGGAITRITGPGGVQPNCASVRASVSGDGRFVTFDSCATNLIAGDTNNASDVFLLDRNSGVVSRVSVSSAEAESPINTASFASAISPNGNFVAFLSAAGWDGGTAATVSVYLRDLVNGNTFLVSRASGVSGVTAGSDVRPSVANDGTVAFASASSLLVSGDTNGVNDVFVRTGATGGSPTTSRVSVSSTGAQLTAASTRPSISADAQRVAFETAAAVVPEDLNGLTDVYVRAASNIALVSRTAGGSGGNGNSLDAAISANGTHVSFTSQASDFGGDFDALFDVFRATLSAGTPVTVTALTRISVSTGDTTRDSGSSDVADAGLVAFSSDEPLLVANDVNGDTDVFTGDGVTTTRHTFPAAGLPESYSGDSSRPAPSYDGTIVAFLSSTTNLVSGDTNGRIDVFVRNRTTSATERLPIASGFESFDADWVSISHDGRFVAYNRGAAFLYDRFNRTTTLISTATPGGGAVAAAQPRISASGRYVAYLTAASFDPADTNGLTDVYRWDRLTGAQLLASRGASAGTQAASAPGISGDGNLVTFVSGATNLATDGTTDGNARPDVFVRNVSGATTKRLSAGLDATANVFMRDPFISADGAYVTFLVSASQLSAEATAVASDVFVVKSDGTGLRGSLSGTTEGVGTAQGAYDPSLSMFGRFLAFRSYATTLVAGDTNNAADVFARQILGASAGLSVGGVAVAPAPGTFGAAVRVSVAGASTQGTGGTGIDTENPEISGNGRAVVYQSGFTNLVGDDTNAIIDAFIRAGLFGNGECDYLPAAYVTYAQQYGLDPCANAGSPFADPDGDGWTNDEERNGAGDGNPVLGTFTRYFAEGATKTAGLNFDTRIALANPSNAVVTGEISYQLPSGATVPVTPFTLQPYERRTVQLDEQPGIAENGPDASYEFSTTVKASGPIGVDRTMTWDKSAYSGHAETGVVSASRKWYFAEGATIGGFNLFYLLQNPSAAPVTVEGRFLLGTGAVHTKTYTLQPNSRFNIWANVESINNATPLANAELSAEFTVTSGAEIIAERAMYRGSSPLFKAGHESAGVTELSTEWFLAEGNAGAFFDEFVLIGNTTGNAALVQADFIVGNTGTIYSKQYQVNPNSRFNIWVDEEEVSPGVFPFRTGNTDVSVRIRSLNGVPLIVERAMWWPGSSSTWYEAHNSPGSTRTSGRWVVAEGENAGALGWNTYILVANTGTTAGSVRIRLLGPNGQTGVLANQPLAAQSRTTYALADLLAAAGLPASSQAGVLIESETGSLPLVVERAMYRNVNGVTFQVGTNALGTPLP